MPEAMNPLGTRSSSMDCGMLNRIGEFKEKNPDLIIS